MLLVLSIFAGLGEIALRLLLPSYTPPGIATTLLSILFFGSLNFFGIGVLGQHLAKVFPRGEVRSPFHTQDDHPRR